MTSRRSSLELDFPDKAPLSFTYRGTGRDRPRYYKHATLGWELPGVTSILQPWDKAGLISWAANLEREACLEAAEKTFEDGLYAPKSGVLVALDFRETMEMNLGAARAHQRQRDKAADIGSEVHAWAEWALQGEIGKRGPEPQRSDPARLACIAWELEWRKSGISAVQLEQPVWCLDCGFAGTVDVFALRDGKLGIVDLKTAKGIYGSNHLQVAAYMHAASELGLPVEWAELWRLPKTMEDLQVERIPLGQLYGGRMASQEQLWDSFKGIHQAWQTLIEPARDGEKGEQP